MISEKIGTNSSIFWDSEWCTKYFLGYEHSRFLMEHGVSLMIEIMKIDIGQERLILDDSNV